MKALVDERLIISSCHSELIDRGYMDILKAVRKYDSVYLMTKAKDIWVVKVTLNSDLTFNCCTLSTFSKYYYYYHFYIIRNEALWNAE